MGRGQCSPLSGRLSFSHPVPQRGWHLPGPPPLFTAPCRPLPRVKPAGSVNDVALDAFDLDRMKQVSVYFPARPEGARGRDCLGP